MFVTYRSYPLCAVWQQSTAKRNFTLLLKCRDAYGAGLDEHCLI